MTTIEIRNGFPDQARSDVAALYWAAFRDKLGRVMGPNRRALDYLADVMDPTHCLTAWIDGDLVGIAGFKSQIGALAEGDTKDFTRHYGQISGRLRIAALQLLTRDVENQRFLLDGLCVALPHRGKGVGTALLAAIDAEAARRGYGEIRLDVIDRNLRARALYERQGFAPLKTEDIGLLSKLFGFRRVTAMTRSVGSTAIQTSPSPGPKA